MLRSNLKPVRADLADQIVSHIMAPPLRYEENQDLRNI